MEETITKEIQKMDLEILKEFKNICSKYNLRYYAIGGTCIGAVRHHGYIPWDDDIDVAMPLEDFIKLREVAKEELHYPYELIDYKNDGYENLNFFKIQNVNTTYIEKSEISFPERYKGIFIDIMPIIGCPNKEKEKNKLINKLKFYTYLNLIRNASVREFSKYKRIIWRILHFLLKHKPKTYYIEKWENELKKYKFGELQNVLFPWRIPLAPPYSNVFEYNFFSEAIQLPFEDTTISVPVDYDGYLKKDFGNYMEIPPVEKRNSCHKTEIIDLKKSYKEYRKGVIR